MARRGGKEREKLWKRGEERSGEKKIDKDTKIKGKWIRKGSR